MQLLGTTNIGLTMGDGTVVPVVRAILSDWEEYHTRDEMNNLMLQIYNASLGQVAACSIYMSERDGVLSQPYSGEKIYGNLTTGLALKARYSGRENSWHAIYMDLCYNGRVICANSISTGYSYWEYGFLVIFTDANYNLIYSRTNPIAGINIRADGYNEGNMGITNAGDGGFIAAPLQSIGTYYDRQNDAILILGVNIKDDISQELGPDTDPFGPGGSSGPGGGQGTFDGTGDDIDIPGLPTLSAVDTGFITLFNPTLGQLQSLANYMWSDLFSLDTFKKLFANPMDAILGLSIVPVAVPNGGTKDVTVGNISTGVSMTVAARQYVEVDCGSLDVQEYWGAYLDYDPYTKCSLYLPYIGTHPIATDDVMGKIVHVVYHVDILSGACTAFVKCGGSVLYQFIGQVASSIPITGDNFTNVINGVLNIAGSIGTMVATSGFSAPAAAAKAGLSTAYKAGHMLGAGSSIAQDVMSMKPQVEHSGGLSGTGGMLSVQVPYMILERPNQAIPARQNEFMGYPAYITATLGDLSGYTEVEHIHLENIPCTEDEANEILSFLENGVIL